MTSDHPGATRLYALLAGVLLSLLGVLGFFFDSSFKTGTQLASDDLWGLLLVNGWRNVIYLVTGLLALTFAGSKPRATALGIGAFYAAFGIWGISETNFGFGSILDAVPVADRDNVLHLVLGGLGLTAFVADGGLRGPAAALAKLSKPRPKAKQAKGERGGRRRSTARPRRDAGA